MVAISDEDNLLNGNYQREFHREAVGVNSAATSRLRAQATSRNHLINRSVCFAIQPSFRAECYVACGYESRVVERDLASRSHKRVRCCHKRRLSSVAHCRQSW